MNGTTTRRQTMLSLTAVGIAVLSAAGSTPAYAADEPLLLSTDGVNWSASIDDGLFSDGITLIPGGSYDDMLWVMSTVAGSHELTASLCDTTVSSLSFGEVVTMGASVPSSARSDSASLNQASSECAVILAPTVLSQGEALPITLTFSMAETASNADTIGAHAAFSIGVTISDIVGGGTAPGGSNGSAPVAGSPSGSGPRSSSTSPSAGGDHGDLSTPYTVRLQTGLGDIDTRAFPAEPGTKIYSEAGSRELPLQPTLYGWLALAFGIFVSFFFVILARRRRRDDDDEEMAPTI